MEEGYVLFINKSKMEARSEHIFPWMREIYIIYIT